MMDLPLRAIPALAEGKCCVRIMERLLHKVHPQKERMLQCVRQGYSCTTEVVAHMIRELGYGGRRAHRICATLVRIARERDIPAPQLTGALLDEAARMVEEEPPGIDTPVLQNLLDPVHFIENHAQVGGPAPRETLRMLATRRDKCAEARKRQAHRVEQENQGAARLTAEISRIRSARKRRGR